MRITLKRCSSGIASACCSVFVVLVVVVVAVVVAAVAVVVVVAVVARGRSCMGAQARSKQGAGSRKNRCTSEATPYSKPLKPKKTDKNCDTVLSCGSYFANHFVI